MFSVKSLVFLAAAAVAAPQTAKGGQTVAQHCGENANHAYCCNSAQKSIGSVLPIDLGSCQLIPVLAVPVVGSCNGQVCCGGQQNGLVNIQCTNVQT
ncbi:hypothetical protein CDD83_9257 [Cordyceps sp. RAO-2017]|nr:hypothetical protein CDD83_9257 [Cordyceps sp. RAO-2017]